MLTETELLALTLTLKLALTTTLILLLVGTPLAWWLARTQWRFRFLLEAIIALPLVLPPTVLGFYLLLALGPNGIIGSVTGPLAFSFAGLVIGSTLYSLPFVVQPLQNAFAAIGDGPLEAAATLKASPMDRFITVVLPLARGGFITAAVLGFAHTLGEFGVVLMIGGNIVGETAVMSIAIYDSVEGLEYNRAHWLSGCMLVLSFVLLTVIYAINRRLKVLPS